MKHFFALNSFLALSLLNLAGCNSQDIPPILSFEEFEPLTVRATSDIDLPSAPAHITFVPNTVAPWLGHVIIVDEQQNLFRTDGQGNTPEQIANIKARDAFGLFRPEATGVFLTLSTDGTLAAYSQSSNENEFAPLILSQNTPVTGVKFCEGGDPLTGTGALISETQEVIRFSIPELGPDAISITFSNPVKSKTEPAGCAVNSDQSITYWPEAGTGPFQILNVDNDPVKVTAPTLLPNSLFGETAIAKAGGLDGFAFRNTSGDYLITIENGLSIYAPENIEIVAGSDKSFGGTFNNGLIVASTNDPEPRLVLISLDYINREIEKLD